VQLALAHDPTVLHTFDIAFEHGNIGPQTLLGASANNELEIKYTYASRQYYRSVPSTERSATISSNSSRNEGAFVLPREFPENEGDNYLFYRTFTEDELPVFELARQRSAQGNGGFFSILRGILG
jgi:hypothetical protein